ncbi:MAG: excinuclease ABC subunit UvrA, partial [Bdellovibrionaceae bacterium]|nr:excinuclease ABC subunit UvrA [Pseudobdellovibrionaceae bacterium]
QIPTTGMDFESIISDIQSKLHGEKFYVLAPVAKQKKGEFSKNIQGWIQLGLEKAKIDGEWVTLRPHLKLAKTKPHDIDLVIDQLIGSREFESRLKVAVKKSLELAQQQVLIETINGKRHFYSAQMACAICGFSFPKIDQKFFSFNSPQGACQLCKGLGSQEIQEREIVNYHDQQKVIEGYSYTFHGNNGHIDEDDERNLQYLPVCPACQGKRLRPESLSVYFDGKNIWDLGELEICDLIEWCEIQENKNKNDVVLLKILKEMKNRLSYLHEIGCGYLTLNRPASTLSGGEAQRLRLAAQLGMSLTGVLYVLDEPSIGLHPRDHHRLLNILNRLKEQGNTILVVEHDEETIRAADWIIDMGPGAGKSGGKIVAYGGVKDILESNHSLTGSYLKNNKSAVLNKMRSQDQLEFITLHNVKHHNLKNISVSIPLQRLTVVTGVSGSGKSSLVMETLYPAIQSYLGYTTHQLAQLEKIEGVQDQIDRVVEIDQKPIGRTSRSTPATYIDLAPLIRQVFAAIPEAKMRGFNADRFSFNSKSGQCAACRGLGVMKLAMNFLADAWVTCQSCEGKRFNQDTLSIKYKSKSIADVMNLTVQEAYDFFYNFPSIRKKLETLKKVGMHYITLGQAAPSLSGGEAQRLKLAKELSKRSTGKTLYILDEPSTGLHFEDVRLLIMLLQELVDSGNTVVVIEHQLDIIASADWLIELGEEGGHRGGKVIFQGFLGEYLHPQYAHLPTWQFLNNKIRQLSH